jgi:hypothetical protein
VYPLNASPFQSFHWLIHDTAIIAIEDGEWMRTVNVPKLKDRLREHLPFAKRGEEVDPSELKLVAAGKLRLPAAPLDVTEIEKIPTGRVKRNRAIQAVVADRDERR